MTALIKTLVQSILQQCRLNVNIQYKRIIEFTPLSECIYVLSIETQRLLFAKENI